MMGSFNTRFAQPGDIAELYDPGRRRAALVGRLRGQRARPAGVGPAASVHGDEDLPEDHRDLRRTGVLVQPRQRRHCGHDRQGGSAAAGQRPALLPCRHAARRRAGRLHARHAVGDSRTSLANNPNPERETDRALYVALVDWVVKGTPPPPSAYPRVSDGTLVPATSAAMGWPDIPERAQARRRRQPGARLRLRSGVSLQRQLRRHDERAAADQARHSDARPEGRRRRQRDRRREVAPACACRSAPTRAGIRLRAAPLKGRERVARRRLHPVCEDQGRAARGRRSATVDRGALSRACGRTTPPRRPTPRRSSSSGFFCPRTPRACSSNC